MPDASVSKQSVMSLRLTDDEFARLDRIVERRSVRGARASRQGVVAEMVRRALDEAERER